MEILWTLLITWAIGSLASSLIIGLLHENEDIQQMETIGRMALAALWPVILVLVIMAAFYGAFYGAGRKIAEKCKAKDVQ